MFYRPSRQHRGGGAYRLYCSRPLGGRWDVSPHLLSSGHFQGVETCCGWTCSVEDSKDLFRAAEQFVKFILLHPAVTNLLPSPGWRHFYRRDTLSSLRCRILSAGNENHTSHNAFHCVSLMASASVRVWRTVAGHEIFSPAPPFLDVSSSLSAAWKECGNGPASFTLLLAAPFTDAAGQVKNPIRP